MLDQLLYRPDKANAGMEGAGRGVRADLKLTPRAPHRAMRRAASTHDYHLNRFLFEHFPRGAAFPAVDVRAGLPDELPLAERGGVQHRRRHDDRDRRCVLGDAARERQLAHRYPHRRAGAGHRARLAARRGWRASGCPRFIFPAARSPCCRSPRSSATRWTRRAIRPALSLYVEIAPDFRSCRSTTRVERVAIAANLRHDALEPVFNEDAARGAARWIIRFGAELTALWRLAAPAGSGARGKDESERGAAAGIQLLRRERPRADRRAAARHADRQAWCPS